MKRTPRRIDRLTPEQRRCAVVRRVTRDPSMALMTETWVVNRMFSNKHVKALALADVLREVQPWLVPEVSAETFVRNAIRLSPANNRLRLEVEDR